MKWMRFTPCDFTATNPIQVIELDVIVDEDVNALDEAIKAVNEIAATHPAPYTLMLSGGIDSQAMLYAWIKAGVKFNALTIRYCGMNEHDISTMLTFLRANNLSVSIEYKDFDVINFLETEYFEFAESFRCTSPHIGTYAKMSELVKEGTVIFSGDFMPQPGSREPSLDFSILGLQRYADVSKRSIIPFFFLHTQALAFAFTKYFSAFSEKTSYVSKTEIYQQAGFPVAAQENKLTGFELIKEHYDQFSSRVSKLTRLRFAGRPSRRVFDQLFRYPLMDKFNNPRVVYRYSFLEKKGTK